MSMLSNEQRENINNFIANNNPTKLPLIDLKARKTIKRTFENFMNNNHDLIIFGSEGFSYSNGFYRNNNNIYVVTFNYDKLESYALYEEGYEDV